MKLAEKMKQEALERMKILKVDENIIKFFEKYNILYVSNPTGRASQLSDKEKEIVKRYEKKWNILIYYLIHIPANIGDEYHLLFVSKNKDDWNDEKEDLKQGRVLTQRLVLDYIVDDETNYINVWSNSGAIVIGKVF